MSINSKAPFSLPWYRFDVPRRNAESHRSNRGYCLKMMTRKKEIKQNNFFSYMDATGQNCIGFLYTELILFYFYKCIQSIQAIIFIFVSRCAEDRLSLPRSEPGQFCPVGGGRGQAPAGCGRKVSPGGQWERFYDYACA